MNSDEIKSILGPCGLLCEKCFAYADGVIKKSSIELRNALGNFKVYAERFTVLLNEPEFSKYEDFKTLLDHFTEGGCRGCRLDGCRLFTGCKVRGCSIAKQVDYCFECDSFPCGNTGFDENLYSRWIAIQSLIKETGIETYYSQIKDKPRY